jgi:hypothetical protein
LDKKPQQEEQQQAQEGERMDASVPEKAQGSASPHAEGVKQTQDSEAAPPVGPSAAEESPSQEEDFTTPMETTATPLEDTAATSMETTATSQEDTTTPMETEGDDTKEPAPVSQPASPTLEHAADATTPMEIDTDEPGSTTVDNLDVDPRSTIDSLFGSAVSTPAP